MDMVQAGDCSVRVARKQGSFTGSTVAALAKASNLHEPCSMQSTAVAVALLCSDPNGVRLGICAMLHTPQAPDVKTR
jgi:hypothetical protein